MALIKIVSISFGVNSALQEWAHTEISVSCCKKPAIFFCAEVTQIYQHSLGKNTSFSVNTKSVFVKQAWKYSKLLHFSSTAFGRNHTHLAFILHLLAQVTSCEWSYWGNKSTHVYKYLLCSESFACFWVKYSKNNGNGINASRCGMLIALQSGDSSLKIFYTDIFFSYFSETLY